MPRRHSLHIDGFSHVNPIPAAARVGNLLMSGLINGTDPATGKPAPTLAEQCAWMFRHVRQIVESAGGHTDDIVKMSVWLQDRTQREAVNVEWLKMFPDPHNRPARLALQADLTGGLLVQCDITALIDAPMPAHP
ncbi:MAG: RidA family protein [Caldimonas sp.]